jgi:hypothetical protein
MLTLCLCSSLLLSWANRVEYARLVLDFRLHEFAAPVRAIREGLTAVIPARFLSLLTSVCGAGDSGMQADDVPRVLAVLALKSALPVWFVCCFSFKELELEVCGQAEIDIEVLKANTVYSGCSPHDQHIKHFWTVLTAFSQLERSGQQRHSLLAVDGSRVAHTCAVLFSVVLNSCASPMVALALRWATS